MTQDYVLIKAGKSTGNYFKDLWRYRELLYFLSWRDILVRYKQTAIGILWSVIKPILTILIFSVVFGKIAKLPQAGIPYPLLVLAGLLPWYFFSSSLSESSLSLISNSNLITKVYFPRLLLPISSIIVSLIDFIISFVLLLILMVWYDLYPGWEIILLPVFILLAFIPALGAGLWFSAFNVRFRDFRYIVPFILQLGLLISPVGFSSSLMPGEWRMLYSLNPLVGAIDGFRWALLGEKFDIYLPGFIISVGISVLLLITGLMYFRKTEKVFADII
ncbi:MAG: ABC transporter permease [Ignavibacteriae bacterium]|nr:ABC transporter permease [Ignavibacteriota bacterium]